ncbi:MAG: hypothetical protein RQ824_05120 [bacterium]|nr:hypothetical protein [bacterium]
MRRDYHTYQVQATKQAVAIIQYLLVLEYLKALVKGQAYESDESGNEVRCQSKRSLPPVTMSGEAVFVYYSSGAGQYLENHKGKVVSEVSEDKERKFAFVQELLNQVLTRKRSVDDYTLIEEDGYYGEGAVNAVGAFKENFNITVNTSTDNLTDTFGKIVKDYGLSGKETNYLNRIIDKETLVGTELREGDNLINDGSSITDTGLYELYVNVVRTFVGGMIVEAERYAGLSGTVRPTGNWRSRNDYGADNCKAANPACVGEHDAGMSYCFGCKQTVADYNSTVSRWGAPPNSVYQNITSTYRGDINDATGLIGATDNAKKWAGLNSGEIKWDIKGMSK